MEIVTDKNTGFHRYHIETNLATDIVPWPNKFLVKVDRYQLAKLLIEEVFHQRGDVKAITSRPCMYGTFSGPVGGFAPRPQYCVGCLRCMTQHPKTVTIFPNPAREALGDSYFHFLQINAVAYEAETGSIPVKGAGYRGLFGGQGWDGMWTDMSEIVRPTRDGIHGREYISTVVDVGEKPSYLVFDEAGKPVGALPRTLSIPIPFIYDIPPKSVATKALFDVLAEAASETQTYLLIPFSKLVELGLELGDHIVPIVKLNDVDRLVDFTYPPKMVEIELDETTSDQEIKKLIENLNNTIPDAFLIFRSPYIKPDRYLHYMEHGIRIFHLVANYHGRGSDGRFVLDLIREAHQTFVGAGIREEVTLIGSGGIVAAEHVPKAIIAGLDLVALDTPLMVALQGYFHGECVEWDDSNFTLPDSLSLEWGVQRLKNMTAAWRDQLLEILGAMGLREVRRLRGEIGRAMFQVDLEREVFSEIEGYE